MKGGKHRTLNFLGLTIKIDDRNELVYNIQKENTRNSHKTSTFRRPEHRINNTHMNTDNREMKLAS